MRCLVALIVLVAGGSLGCREEKLRDTLPPDVRVDTYAQVGASKVDVLWVVDNSGSMVPRQENLARNFRSFIDVFSRSKIDYRLGVTTTDIFVDQGQLKGNPKVLSPAVTDIEGAFARNIKVGTSGSAYEAGLQAAVMSLERQAQANAPVLQQWESCVKSCSVGVSRETCVASCDQKHPISFLRPGAYLYLVFVTDEEDRSEGDIRYFWRTFETIKGVGNDGTVTTAAIIGDVPSNGCGATPGTRYHDLSALTGGEVGSICDAEFASTLRKLATSAVGLKRKFALSLPPNAETIEIEVRYRCDVDPAIVQAGCAELDQSACAGASSATLGMRCVPPKGGENGWSYEPANQVLFFAGDSVPYPGAEIDILYYEEGKQP